MFKDSFLDNANLQTILDTRRSNKSGLFPVKYRITQNRKQFYYASGLNCSIADWEIIESSKKVNLVVFRNEIQLGHDTMKRNINLVIENNKGQFSIDKLNNILGKNVTDTLNSAFTAKINNSKADGKIGTSIYYNCALQSITKFKGENIKFLDITVDWLNKYQQYMLDNKSSYTTIGMYCRAIRTIINEAKANGIIKENEYPFGKGKYEIPTGESRKMALTLKKVGELMKAEVTETEKKYRDLWFFSYLCNGINIGDLCRLKYSDINDNVISFYRQKTINTSKHKVKIEAAVLPQMIEIVERWNIGRNQGLYLFPFLTGNEDPEQTKKQVQNITRLINKHIKRIGLRLGIEGISTYTARHSFATVLKRSGTNIAFISDSLGHTSTNTTKSYLDSFETEEKFKNANLLIPE
ncbi:MAG: tyrosine-type recombinase/integrase [Bacteroidales bacterium]